MRPSCAASITRLQAIWRPRTSPRGLAPAHELRPEAVARRPIDREVVGELEARAAERIERRGEHDPILEPERVDLPEIGGGRFANLVLELHLDLVGDPRVGHGVTLAKVARELLACGHGRPRQVLQRHEPVIDRESSKVVHELDAHRPPRDLERELGGLFGSGVRGDVRIAPARVPGLVDAERDRCPPPHGAGDLGLIELEGEMPSGG
jgi:hypothetical protein